MGGFKVGKFVYKVTAGLFSTDYIYILYKDIIEPQNGWYWKGS